jgi:hypothetical protein
MIRSGRSAEVEVCSVDCCLSQSFAVEKIMKRASIAFSVIFALVAYSGLAIGQKVAFDGNKFFDEIASQGFSAPAKFDAGKFFDEISQQGYSNEKQMDAQKFFDLLASRGFKVPPDFDAKKFFEMLAARGYTVPPMVETHILLKKN